MSLTRYYQVLGLEAGASDQEVRRRYRSLAMRYHPDKNPSPEAVEKFIRLKEAYEAIINRSPEPKKKRNVQKNDYSREREHKDRIMEARRRYQEQKLKEERENERYYQDLIIGRKWKIIRILSLAGAIFSIMMVLDLFLPSHFEKDRVAEFARDVYTGHRGRGLSLIRTEQHKDVWIEGLNFSLYAYYPDVYIERSWILNDPINVISIQKTGYAYFPAHYTFHSVTIEVVLIFLIPVFTVWYKRRTITFTIFWHLSLYLTGPVMIIFLLTNHHWAHILTLGFL